MSVTCLATRLARLLLQSSENERQPPEEELLRSLASKVLDKPDMYNADISGAVGQNELNLARRLVLNLLLNPLAEEADEQILLLAVQVLKTHASANMEMRKILFLQEASRHPGLVARLLLPQ